MIRPMCAADVPQIAALERLCFSDPWCEAAITPELTNPLSTWLVAQEDDALAGYIGAQAVPPDADVMNLAVAPNYRRRGLARSLLHELTQCLRKQGVNYLFLEVRASNLPAQSLYASAGFVEVGRRKKYYVNPVEDALILRKEL